MNKDRLALVSKETHVIIEYCKLENVTFLQGMEDYFTSNFCDLIFNKVGDIHCQGDIYLARRLIDSKKINR